MSKKNIYIVVKGKKTGLYTTWLGPRGAAVQVSGVPGAVYKGFSSREQARDWLEEIGQGELLKKLETNRAAENTPKPSTIKTEISETTQVTIYTDGGALGNPGPGGYGVVLLYKKMKKELSGGYRHTTNNRMELMACIKGLEALKYKCEVVLSSDSKYVINGIEKGWAKKWRKNGWMRNKIDKAKNADLWAQLLALCEKQNVKFRWVKGHAGHRYNERCDRLAYRAARKKNLQTDQNFEAQHRPRK